MLPYIAHGFLLKLFALHHFEFYKNLYFTFFGGFVFSILVVYFCGKDKVSNIYNKAFEKVEYFFLKK